MCEKVGGGDCETTPVITALIEPPRQIHRERETYVTFPSGCCHYCALHQIKVIKDQMSDGRLQRRVGTTYKCALA